MGEVLQGLLPRPVMGDGTLFGYMVSVRIVYLS